MDAAKLKNVLVDLTPTFDQISIRLEELITHLQNGQYNKLNNTLEELEADCDAGMISSYPPSNLKIVEHIGANIYFGHGAYNKVSDIFDDHLYDSPTILDQLVTYNTERNTFIDLLKSTQKGLDELNIESHFHTEVFEIGLLMPEEFTDGKIVEVTKELNKWDKVLKNLREIHGEPIEETRISFINNGSLEFFIDNATSIAISLVYIIEKVAKLYEKIVKIRAARAELIELGGLPAVDRKAADKIEKDVFNNGVETIAQDLIRSFANRKIEEGRLNELKVAVSKDIVYVAKCIDRGMVIEVIPPEPTAPTAIKETDSEEQKDSKKKLREDYNKKLKQIDIVQKAMKEVKSIGKTGVEIVKYLTEGETEKEDNKNAESDEEE